jgi:hypothetical protein
MRRPSSGALCRRGGKTPQGLNVVVSMQRRSRRLDRARPPPRTDAIEPHRCPARLTFKTRTAARSCREYFFVTYSGKAYSVDPGEKCNRYKRILASSVRSCPNFAQ